jgi:MHS family proline/betaine transporter-like MFS transporter
MLEAGSRRRDSASALGGQRRTILAGIAGNVMEWYDFTVYGYFASIIGAQFFPSDNRLSSLIASFGVFAAGFLMRPIGSLVFGHIGDRVGRKAALTMSVSAMAVPTFLIGLLPTYQQVGVAAPVGLTLLRLIQGLSVGGEYTTSFIFLVEQAPPQRRGLLGSWGPFGVAGGLLLGSGIGTLLTSVLDPQAVSDWGWRLPFCFGIVVGLTGLYIRRNLAEPAPAPATAAPRRSPLGEAFRVQWRKILQVIGFNVVSAIGFYLCFIYVTSWLRQVEHLAPTTAFDINTGAIALLLLLIPLAGALSDRIGRKPVLFAGAGGLLVLAWPLFWLMHHPKASLVLVGQLGFAMLISALAGASPAALVEAFPRSARCTGLSVGYNFCMAAFGGTAPMVAVYTFQHTHDDLSAAYYLMAAALVSLLVFLGLRETVKAPLA